jgi:hypothetical protein
VLPNKDGVKWRVHCCMTRDVKEECKMLTHVRDKVELLG